MQSIERKTKVYINKSIYNQSLALLEVSKVGELEK